MKKSNDIENRKELQAELNRRIDAAKVRIDQGYAIKESGYPIEHPGFINIDIPGDVGGTFKVIATPERLEQIRKNAKGIFNATPKKIAHPWKRSGSSKAAALKAFIDDGEFDNARNYAQVTGQIPYYKKLRNAAELNGHYGE